MNMKIGFTRSNLSGVNGVAAGLLANSLNKAMNRQQTANTWALCLSLVVDAIAGIDNVADRVAAIEPVFVGIRTAIGSTIVAQHLADAGYGALTSIVEDEDGKESLPGAKRSEWTKRYGDKFRLAAAVKDATKLADQYRSNIIAAVSAGAVLVAGMTGRDMAKAAKDAALDAMDADERKAVEDAAATERQSRECGVSFASAYKAGTPELRQFLAAVSVIADGWDKVSEGDVSELIDHVSSLADFIREDQDDAETGPEAAAKLLENSITSEAGAATAATA